MSNGHTACKFTDIWRKQMRTCFRIGSVVLAVESEYPTDCGGLFSAFRVADDSAADLVFRVAYADTLPPCENAAAFPNLLRAERDGTVYRFYLDSRTGLPFACTYRDGAVTQIRILRQYAPWGALVGQLFPLLALHHTLLQKSQLLMHGAFLTVHGEGLMFTGRSGIGKTTQSRLWQSCCGAHAVNEDRLVLEVSAQTTICGVPVAGSSPFCGTDTAPLKAIILLGQSAENTLVRLPAAKALPRLLSSVYLPEGFAEDLPVCTDLLLKVCADIPVYQLDCRPDAESVELVRQAVFEEHTEWNKPI